MSLDSKELAQSATDELLEAGWLMQIPSPKQPQGGHPFSPVFQIHPKAREILEGVSHEVVSVVSVRIWRSSTSKGLCQLCQSTPAVFKPSGELAGVSWDARLLEKNTRGTDCHN